MSRSISVASTCLLTLFFAWIPLALGGFGAFLFFGLIFCLIPSFFLFLPPILFLLTRPRAYFHLLPSSRFFVILGTLSFCCMTPWILLAAFSDPNVHIGTGYWMVASGFLVFGSFLTMLIKNKRGSEQAVAHQRAIIPAITSQPPSQSRPWADI